jgi:hypothetical protein
MKYIIVSILIILLLVLVCYNKETFTGSIIKKNLNEINDKLPQNTKYKKLIKEITDQLKTDLNKGYTFSENIDQSNISEISRKIVSDTEIQNSIKALLKDDDNLKQISKGNMGEKGDSGISTENDVLEADILKIGDKTINETKLGKMIDFSERNKNLIGNKLIINSNINEQKAQELALDDGTTLIPKLNLGGNIMAKDGEFIKIENGFINKLKIGNQVISSQSDKLVMDNVNITSAEVKDLLVKDNNLNPGPKGLTGDTGLQGWGIESGEILGNKVIFTTKGGNTFNVNFDTETPIDNLYGPRGVIGNKGVKGGIGPPGFSASEGELSEDGTLTLSYNLSNGSKQNVTFTGDKLKGGTGDRGLPGNTGLKGTRGIDITNISLEKNTDTNNLKLNLNGDPVGGEYNVMKGDSGDNGTKGKDGKNFELEGIENTTDGLLFKKDLNAYNICFDENQEYCIDTEINKNLLLNNLKELTYNISKFLNLDQNKNLSEIIQDIFVYYENITSYNPSEIDITKYNEEPYYIYDDDNDNEANLVKIAEIKKTLFETTNNFDKIELCKIAGIDVLNLHYRDVSDSLNSTSGGDNIALPLTLKVTQSKNDPPRWSVETIKVIINDNHKIYDINTLGDTLIELDSEYFNNEQKQTIRVRNWGTVSECCTWDLYEIKLTDANGTDLTTQIKNLREDGGSYESGYLDPYRSDYFSRVKNLTQTKKEREDNDKYWTYDADQDENWLHENAFLHSDGQWFEFDLDYTHPPPKPKPKLKQYEKLNKIIEYIGTKLNITSGSVTEKIEKILEKQPDDIKEAYLRYMFEFLGFDKTTDDFFNTVKDKVKEVFGEDIENEIDGIKESDIKVDTIQNKEKLLNILLNFFTYKDNDNNTKLYKI